MAATRRGPTDAGGSDTPTTASPGPAPASTESGAQLTTLDGRYRIVERIAAGGMGEVFRAHDAVLDREVAIKVLHRSLAGDTGFIERFRREARAAAALGHGNIVAVHDWGAIDGIYFMVMEFIHGQSLREILNQHGRLAPAHTADVVDQVLAALELAHATGIVHRDIKPENFMITPEGGVKVADFGLARAYAEGKMTSAATVSGTVQYLAPEQIRGEPADPRTDLYSLGIVTYELLTGRLPFTGETAMAIAYKHLSDRVPAPSTSVPDLPRGLDGFVRSATERDRELRPESATEMRRDLAGEQPSLPVTKPLAALVRDDPVVIPQAAPERAETVTIERRGVKRVGRKPRWRKVVGVLVLLLMLAGGAWAAWEYAIPHFATVPHVVGTRAGQAANRLEELGLVVHEARGVYSLEFDRGEVVRVDPPAGTELEEGTRVELTASLGPRPVPIPDVQGMTLARAQDEIRAAGLKPGDVAREFSERVDEGRVISQRPRADGEASETSPVDLVVSKGPPPVEVRDVAGRNVDAATALLEDDGFVVNVIERYSDSVPREIVMSQSPEPGGKRPQGSTITLTISAGPRTVKLPSLVGMAKGQAIRTLEELGLHARSVVLPNSSGQTVVTQDPDAGVEVRGGSTVTIFLA